MNFYLGCAVWSYGGWVGNFYPPKSRPKDFLHLYSQRFSTVEGNTTFYAVPDRKTITRWVEQTPAGFKFCPKFPQTVSHRGLLVDAIPAARDFLTRMEGLGDRLGTVFLQLPPSYSPEYLADLQEFLKACSAMNCSLGVEVRHLDWFEKTYCDCLNDLLFESNISRVLLDTRPIYNCSDNPQINSTRRKPQVPVKPVITGDVGFVRFISHPTKTYNEFWLQEWIDYLKLHRLKTIYFFVHCPQEENSPNTAKYFQSQLKKQGVNVPDLPWDNIAPVPTQLSLF
ncbi:MAG: DUF72 domain-containing protein [Pleurocapsa sp.]